MSDETDKLFARAEALRKDPWAADRHSKAVAALLEDIINYVAWLEEAVFQPYDGE